MNYIEKIFSSHKMVFIFFAVLALPFALIWSLIYGLIIGIIGPTVDIYEIIRNRIYQDTRNLLKYPQWKAEQYQRSILTSAKDMGTMAIRETEEAFKEGKRKAPGMLGYIIRNSLVFILHYPLLLMWGIITGPIRAFLEYLKWCYKVWTGHSYVPI